MKRSLFFFFQGYSRSRIAPRSVFFFFLVLRSGAERFFIFANITERCGAVYPRALVSRSGAFFFLMSRSGVERLIRSAVFFTERFCIIRSINRVKPWP